MSYVPDLHHRRSIRLQAFDYTRDGAYFVTVCSRDRECLFGQVIDGAVNLNEFGQVIGLALTSLPTHFPHVDVPDYVIMPNHLHAIIKIARDDVGAKQGVSASPVSVDIGNSGKADEAFALPLRGTVPGSLAAVVQNFKSVTTRKVNALRGTPGIPVWQRNYYERVIRNEAELAAIREYIASNPGSWDQDRNHPENITSAQGQSR